MERLSDHLYLHRDTCNVPVLADDDHAVVVDGGAGEVLARLAAAGLAGVSDVVVTHHHRDQVQGLARFHGQGARIWVPASERDLIADVEAHWQGRQVDNNYNTRQDRFSLATSVPVEGSLPPYVPTAVGGSVVTAIPMPGHTVGSVGYLVEVDGLRVAFTGDLLYGSGKVWSLAATQWSYAGGEGLAATVLSLLDLRDRKVDLVVPSHGAPMFDPAGAIDLAVERLLALLDLRGQHRNLLDRRARPFTRVLPHLLHNRVAHANSYLLLSEEGTALAIDVGYDFDIGLAAGTDRAARQPWLYTLGTLHEEFGVDRIDVAIPTHHHDDHVAGLNLLRDVEGTSVWSAARVAEVIQDPRAHDLPCTWYDPIPVDRVLAESVPISWNEYELVLHPLPGHTRHQVAIEVEVDGQRVLATGDQHTGEGWLNYVYQNRYRIGDYVDSGQLYVEREPDLFLTGHWGPHTVDAAMRTEFAERGVRLAALHRDLLPLDDLDLGAEGFAARIHPYRSTIDADEVAMLDVTVHNPFDHEASVRLRIDVPPGWRATPHEVAVLIDANASRTVPVAVTPGAGGPTRRAVILADVTVDGQRLGQQAEALVDVQ